MCMYMCTCMLSLFSRVQLFVTPWTVAHQAPPSMGLSRQEYWSGLPLPSLTRFFSCNLMLPTSHILTQCGPLEKGNGKPLQYSCLQNPMNSMKRQNDRTLKNELPRSVGAHYATGDQWRNNSRKNEGMEPKQKQHPFVDGTGDRSKVQCCKSNIA